ncbi:hypothetical protein U1Q18_040376 [Sarracenia purpurea var. burkii]
MKIQDLVSEVIGNPIKNSEEMALCKKGHDISQGVSAPVRELSDQVEALPKNRSPVLKIQKLAEGNHVGTVSAISVATEALVSENEEEGSEEDGGVDEEYVEGDAADREDEDVDEEKPKEAPKGLSDAYKVDMPKSPSVGAQQNPKLAGLEKQKALPSLTKSWANVVMSSGNTFENMEFDIPKSNSDSRGCLDNNPNKALLKSWWFPCPLLPRIIPWLWWEVSTALSYGRTAGTRMMGELTAGCWDPHDGRR